MCWGMEIALAWSGMFSFSDAKMAVEVSELLRGGMEFGVWNVIYAGMLCSSPLAMLT